MKGLRIAGRVVLWVGMALSLIIGLIYVVLEARSLFAGDFVVYESTTKAFFTYFFRLLIALFFIGNAVFSFFVQRIRKNLITAGVIISANLLIVGGFSTFLLGQYYIAYIFILAAALCLIGDILLSFAEKEQA